MRARPIEFDFFTTFAEGPSYNTLQETTKLWECGNPRAPCCSQEEPIKPNCTLKADVPAVPEECFTKRDITVRGLWQDYRMVGIAL